MKRAHTARGLIIAAALCLPVFRLPAEKIPYLDYQLEPNHLDYEAEAVGHYNTLINRARQALERRDWATAYARFEELHGLDVGNHSFLFAMAQIAAWQANWDAVIRHTDRPLDEPYRLQADILRGAALLNTHRHDEAAALFDGVLTADPGSTLARLGLDAALAGREQSVSSGQSEFMRMFRELTASDAVFSAAITANMLFLEGKLEQAVNLMLAEVEQNPDSPDSHSTLAVYYASMGKTDRAQHHMGTALRLAPNNPYVLNNSGVLSMKREDDASAEQSFIRATELYPEYAAAYRNLARLYIARGEWDQARTAALRSVALEPDTVTGRLMAAFSCYRVRALDQALELLYPSITRSVKRPAVWFLAAVCAHMNERFSLAEEYYRAGLHLKPDYVLGLNNLADVILTDANADSDDIAEALELASRASALTSGRNETIQLTLRAAEERAAAFDAK